MASNEVKVPDIGDFKNVEVIEVLVKPGDKVAKEQSLVTLESDKATMEIPSPAAGVVSCFSSFRGFSSPAESRTRIGEPCDTLSPTFTLTDCTVPAPGDGISIVALSDSRVMSDCSLATVSPGFTRISITSTLLKSPMSGTFTSLAGIYRMILRMSESTETR